MDNSISSGMVKGFALSDVAEAMCKEDAPADSARCLLGLSVVDRGFPSPLPTSFLSMDLDVLFGASLDIDAGNCHTLAGGGGGGGGGRGIDCLAGILEELPGDIALNAPYELGVGKAVS